MYTDKCYPLSTENKTDIILNDRKKEYNDKYYGICENNCKFTNYESNNGTKKSKCECQIKTEFKKLLSMDIDKDKLLNKIIDFKSTFNIDVIFCPKTLFSLDGLKSNIGSYILLGNIVTHIICGIFFYIKSFNKIVNLVSSILKIKKNEKIYNKEEGNKNSKEKENISNINDNLILRDAKMDNKIKDSKDKISNSKIDINYNPPNRRNNKKEKINSIINLNFSKNRTFINSKTPCDIKLKNSITLNDNILDMSKNESQKNIYQLTDNKLLNYTDNEMNSLSYNEALKIDKRTYFQYYLSLLKTKH